MIIVAFLLGADLHAVALCCLLQVIAVAPKLLAGIFHEKLDWIKASNFLLRNRSTSKVTNTDAQFSFEQSIIKIAFTAQ